MTKQELVENIKKMDKPGRDKFIKLCETLKLEYGEPENEKLAYDCYIIYKGKKYLVELKDRDPKYEQYDELILEQDKYNRVMKWKERLGAAGAYYCNWFGNTAYLWNLDKKSITAKPAKKWMNKITAASREDKIEKDIYYISKSDAVKHTLLY